MFSLKTSKPYRLQRRITSGHSRARSNTSARDLAYVIPTWIVMLLVGVIPIVYAIWMAISDQSLLSADTNFVGLDNFKSVVFTPRFLGTLGVTLIFVLCCLFIQFTVGYMLAAALNQQLRGFKLARTALLIPMMLTPVVVGLIWRFMFNPDLGVMTFISETLGINESWLAHPILSPALIIVVESWINTPFVTILVLAGMSGIPDELLEASALDGA